MEVPMVLARTARRSWRRCSASVRTGISWLADIFASLREQVQQMTGEAAAHRGAFFGSPGAESFASFHTELALFDPLGKQAGWRARVTQLGNDDVVDVARQLKPDEVGVFHGPQYRISRSKTVLYDDVDGFGIADAVFDEAEGFTPERVLQAVTDEAGDVAMHFNRPLTQFDEQIKHSLEDFRIG